MSILSMLMAAAAKVGPRAQDYFATSTWSGNGATSRTITNGLDLSGKGGMVIIKSRNDANGSGLYEDPAWYDTNRGGGKMLLSDSSNSETNNDSLSGFGSTGFTLGSGNSDIGSGIQYANATPNSYVGWSFAKKAKFFDIVTYTGNGVAGRVIPHSLGVAPGMAISKRRDAVTSWHVWHSGLSANSFINLDTGGQATGGAAPALFGNNSTFINPDAVNVTIGGNPDINASGATYVMYLFAHDPDTTNGIIKCGSYVGNGGNTTVTLGWKPQFLLFKCITSSGTNWDLFDTTRDPLSSSTGNNTYLQLNNNMTESNMTAGHYLQVTSTGFQLQTSTVDPNVPGQTYIYMAIRQGSI